MPNTLFGRLLIASLLTLGLFFAAISYTINELTLANAYKDKQEQLRLQNYILLSSAQMGDENIELPDELREPRFGDYESGLYGYISDKRGKIYWSSYSAHSIELDHSLLHSSQLTQPGQAEYEVTPDYFIYRYTVVWDIDSDQTALLTFTVIEDSHPTLKGIANLQQTLRIWLVGIGLLLISLLMLILRWGTRPLRLLADNLKQIENGEKQHVEGVFPLELQPVTSNLNELIDTERQQRERYHTTLADLAHSLKTPLAVIQTELESSPDKTNHDKCLIAEQAQRMDDIIKHQLQRAVVATQHSLTEAVIIADCVDRLIKAMSKVYASKDIRFLKDIKSDCRIKGDQRDLMEVLGNLLDNACKACTKTIQISTSHTESSTTIEIHDDGAGIPEAQREQLIRRGQRADTRNAGQGIGLDVARDIIESYHGTLSIGQSPLGGACFIVTLPGGQAH